ncbi:glycosyltransferase [Cohnella faecalis]|uniref:Glycosyltransferase family 2 protein n=1 Tax=Cohnella faecalis TaxID=2315694 RepID=A0A398CUZ2_9BACL|nr:glycosyltransferase family 2 protein [Cohnella faecalis]RIE02834.1 glycosyltransferase family 2 protein [Cohnella faecalis]
MIKISLCMIVKNEEDVLARCLDSVKGIADEIVVVDTGSTDRTKEIAAKFTNKVIDFTWVNNFAAARNFAFSQATKPYLMWLDADDVILEEDRAKLLRLKRTLAPDVDSVVMTYCLQKDSYGNITSSSRRNRLVKKARQFRWIGAVHEYLEVLGNIFHSDIVVTHSSTHHDSDRNLRIYEEMEREEREFTPRDLYYYGNELLDHAQHTRAIEQYKKFLATGQGWIEDNISTCGKLADCYHHLNDQEQALEHALLSFKYDKPRADFCCRIAYYHSSKNEIAKAIFWYELAAGLKWDPSCLGFYNSACWTWLPHLQLCVCYDRLGQYEKANEHNEKALAFRPDDASMLANKKYLEGRLKT